MSNKTFGFIILVIGVSFFLVNIGYLDMNVAQVITTYWPVIVIYYGLKHTFRGFVYFTKMLGNGRWRVSKLFWGLLTLAIGIVLQGNKLDYFQITASQFWSWLWPVLIIYFGLTLLFNRKSNLVVIDMSKEENEVALSKKKKKRTHGSKQKQLIGDINIGSTPWLLDDLDMWVGVGDISIDLTTAILKEGINNIDLSGWVGDIKVIVPNDVATEVNVDVKLGDVNIFNNRQSGTNRKVSYRSEDYEYAEKKILVSISMSIGDIKVKREN